MMLYAIETEITSVKKRAFEHGSYLRIIQGAFRV
jgi:hypothetical protein